VEYRTKEEQLTPVCGALKADMLTLALNDMANDKQICEYEDRQKAVAILL
jgi:hypothetical protein